MRDHRDALLAHLRDALRRRYWLQRKMDDTGPSSYDTSRAVWADEEISDLVWYLKGYGVEGVFAALEAEGLIHDTASAPIRVTLTAPP